MAIRVSLKEDNARGVFGSVGGNSKWFRKVREIEDRTQCREWKLSRLVGGTF